MPNNEAADPYVFTGTSDKVEFAFGPFAPILPLRVDVPTGGTEDRTSVSGEPGSIPRPACSCHNLPACVHRENGHPDPDGLDEERGWNWHCALDGCEGYSKVLLVWHEWLLAALAEQQRDNAARILGAVRAASDAGLSWREVGEALGIEHTTVFRQVQAGSPVVVVRPTHDPERATRG